MRRVLPVLASSLALAIVVSPTTTLAQGDAPEPPPPTGGADAAPVPPDQGLAPSPPSDPPADAALPPSAPPVATYNPDAPPPKDLRLILTDLTIFRWNPLGLETRAKIGLQKRLFYSEKAVTRTNFWFAGLYPKLNPASAQVGVGGELQPASVFNLKLYGEVQKFFGSFGYLQSFDSADANYSDNNLDELADGDTTEPEAATILHLGIAPTLQVKVGKIALRTLFQFDYWKFDVRNDNETVYEPTFDTLLPRNGWTVSSDTDLLFTGVPKVTLGLRHTWVHPFYKEKHFASAAQFDAYDDENAHHRLGVIGAYTFKDQGPSTFNKPTVLLILSWYLSHKYRAGEPETIPTGHTSDDYISRAVPYVILGFSFESDFFSPLTTGR